MRISLVVQYNFAPFGEGSCFLIAFTSKNSRFRLKKFLYICSLYKCVRGPRMVSWEFLKMVRQTEHVMPRLAHPNFLVSVIHRFMFLSIQILIYPFSPSSTFCGPQELKDDSKMDWKHIEERVKWRYIARPFLKRPTHLELGWNISKYFLGSLRCHAL